LCVTGEEAGAVGEDDSDVEWIEDVGKQVMD